MKRNCLIITFIGLLSLYSCGNKDSSGKVTSETKTVKQLDDKKDTKIIDIEIVNKVDHDTKAYTQGLLYLNGYLYESTGMRGESSLRKLDIKNGDVLSKYDLPSNIFAEGLAWIDNHFYQISWTEKTCFVYDKNFKKVREFSYFGEGWGLCSDGKNLIMSDGSNLLRVINPKDFSTIKTIIVLDENNYPITNLNELEMINGKLWANIWQKDLIAVIDTASGKLDSYINLEKLRKEVESNPEAEVSNGIAYDTKTDRIFLTGKYWQYMFEVKLLNK